MREKDFRSLVNRYAQVEIEDWQWCKSTLLWRTVPCIKVFIAFGHSAWSKEAFYVSTGVEFLYGRWSDTPGSDSFSERLPFNRNKWGGGNWEYSRDCEDVLGKRLADVIKHDAIPFLKKFQTPRMIFENHPRKIYIDKAVLKGDREEPNLFDVEHMALTAILCGEWEYASTAMKVWIQFTEAAIRRSRENGDETEDWEIEALEGNKRIWKQLRNDRDSILKILQKRVDIKANETYKLPRPQARLLV